MTKKQKSWRVGGALLVAFIALTLALLTIDVQPIGPEQSKVGLATINGVVRDWFGVNLVWYHITDWLGIVPIMVALGFAILGLIQLIKAKSIKRVDKSLIALGAFYVVVIALYVFFEKFIVNVRPILMDGRLEASYPSSHTMIVLCLMGSAMVQFRARIKNKPLKTAAIAISAVIIGVTILGRLISGVHWLTDILGGLLLGTGLATLYSAAVQRFKKR